MKALVGAFNQEKALVGAFSVIVQPVVEPMEPYTALLLGHGEGETGGGLVTVHMCDNGLTRDRVKVQ